MLDITIIFKSLTFQQIRTPSSSQAMHRLLSLFATFHTRYFFKYLYAVCIASGVLTVFAYFPGIVCAKDPVVVDTVSVEFQDNVKNVSQYTVAILPMENFTVEGDVAYHFRTRLTKRLEAKGYTVVDTNLVDQALYKQGVSNAGQLRLLPFETLKSIISADSFLSGVVEQAAIQHAGIYNGYVFTCSLKLQDHTGRVLWSRLQNRVAKRRFALDPINAFLDIALTAGGGDMKQAVFALADIMLSTFPNGPVIVLSTDDALLERAIEVKTMKE